MTPIHRPKIQLKKGGHTLEHIMHVAEFENNENMCHAFIQCGVTLKSSKSRVDFFAAAMTPCNEVSFFLPQRAMHAVQQLAD